MFERLPPELMCHVVHMSDDKSEMMDTIMDSPFPEHVKDALLEDPILEEAWLDACSRHDEEEWSRVVEELYPTIQNAIDDGLFSCPVCEDNVADEVYEIVCEDEKSSKYFQFYDEFTIRERVDHILAKMHALMKGRFCQRCAEEYRGGNPYELAREYQYD